MSKADKEERQWQIWWDARVAALEKVLGKSDEMILHAMIPFDMGPEVGGAADVISFSKHLDKGIIYTTCELIGRDDQVKNRLGNYELAICHRKEDRYGPGIISQLAQYTCKTELQQGETMDIGPAAPKGSTISAFVFLKYAALTVRRRKCGLLLCLGITPAELDAYHDGRHNQLLKALRGGGIYPFTDWKRKSVVSPARPLPNRYNRQHRPGAGARQTAAMPYSCDSGRFIFQASIRRTFLCHCPPLDSSTSRLRACLSG